MTSNPQLYNTLTKRVEAFKPLDPNRVTMYVCGPTVYDHPHIGNGRSIVVYDLLYRLLIQHYGKENIIFTRNITDVDDKINVAAKREGISIRELTTRVIKGFNHEVQALNCLRPNVEPRVTDHIPEIVQMIVQLIANGHAYTTADGSVYFSVASYKDYGKLAGREHTEGVVNSETNDASDKKNPADFALWKPAVTVGAARDDESSIFDSPWGPGRPGWHIECSVMSTKYLGSTFDIHGGGIDLIFPHHTNEIAQSCGCYEGSEYARYWVHNGFLMVNGEKMSKSLGNFLTLHDLLTSGVEGETIRFAYLTTHYRKPLDWTAQCLSDSKKALDSFYRILAAHGLDGTFGGNLHTTEGNLQTLERLDGSSEASKPTEIISMLNDDMNTSEAIAFMHGLAKDYNKAGSDPEKAAIASKLHCAGSMLGLFFNDAKNWFQKTDGVGASSSGNRLASAEIQSSIDRRAQAKADKDWSTADKIRAELAAAGVVLEDSSSGDTTWRME